MNPLERLNQALDYLESRLDEEIDYAELADLACCSEHHFRRIFSFLAGVSLSEYVRLRRMTLAGLELQSTDVRVIDLAVRYGYGSADSFTRAFQGVHGCNPSEARAEKRALVSFPRLSFRMAIEGGEAMNVRLVEKGPCRLVGLKRRVRLIYNGVNPEIAEMWRSLSDSDIGLLKELSEGEPSGLVQGSVNFSEDRGEGTELDHYIGCLTTRPVPDQFEGLEVEPSTWAVFEVRGPFPQTLQQTWGRIFSEWLPSSRFQLARGPELLWNEHKDLSDPRFHSQIWIPVHT